MRRLKLLAIALSMFFQATPATQAKAALSASSGYLLRQAQTSNGANSALSSSYRLSGVLGGDGAFSGKGSAYAVSADAEPFQATTPAGCGGAVGIVQVQDALEMFMGLKAPSACVDLDASNAVSASEVQKMVNSFQWPH